LETLAGELRTAHGVTVDVHPADLADPEQLRRLERRVAEGPALALLVNNAGFGTPGAVAESDPDRMQGMIDVHLTATVRLCHAALPAMIAAGKGAVINVSSVAAFLPIPLGAVYAASKSFLNLFSEALAGEVGEQGIRVQALCPGYTITGFHDTEEYGNFDRSTVPGWLWMSSEAVVDISLAALERNRVIVIAGWRNKLLTGLLRAPVLSAVMRRLAKAKKAEQHQ
jgi:short-subunit dehydrogenase